MIYNDQELTQGQGKGAFGQPKEWATAEARQLVAAIWAELLPETAQALAHMRGERPGPGRKATINTKWGRR
jgi:hypothetical protein